MGDLLAQSMIDILSDENYNKIFERPQVKEASAKESDKEEILKDACNKLLEASDILEKIGLPKSAANVLVVAEGIMKSADAPKKKEEEATIVVSSDAE